MTVQEFAQRVQVAEQESLRRGKLDCEANMNNAITHIHTGPKWTRVDVGSSGRYMIDPQGNIFGIKAYGVPHLRHRYGTLDQPSLQCFRGRWGNPLPYSKLTEAERQNIITAYRQAKPFATDTLHAVAIAASNGLRLTNRQHNSKMGADAFAAALGVLTMAKEVKLNNPISASCPSCRNPMRIPPGMKRGYCPKCGAGLRVARENPIERYHGGLIRKLDKGKWEVTFGTYAGDATKVYLKKAWAQEALRNWQDDYRPSGGYVVDKNQRLY